eukprot:639817-Rhodomonas_salina.3
MSLLGLKQRQRSRQHPSHTYLLPNLHCPLSSPALQRSPPFPASPGRAQNSIVFLAAATGTLAPGTSRPYVSIGYGTAHARDAT